MREQLRMFVAQGLHDSGHDYLQPDLPLSSSFAHSGPRCVVRTGQKQGPLDRRP
jgi:hypothetical protein